MHVALCFILSSWATADTPILDNLNLNSGTLHGWKGEGFYLTTGKPNGPSRSFALCSSDRATPGVTGLIERTFLVPPNAHVLRCQAYASRSAKQEGEALLDIRLETTEHKLVTKKVYVGGVWQSTSGILLPEKGKPREYSWDLTSYRGQPLRLVLVDDDNRPNSYLYTSGFRIEDTPEDETEAFGRVMVALSARYKLSPVSRFDSKHFTALSNTDDEFTRIYLRHGELIYDQFLDHFRSRGFTVATPPSRLMLAIFETQDGFEAYLGRKTPPGVTGLYDRGTNRLVVFDYGTNQALLNQKQQAQDAAKSIASDADRKKYLESVIRQAKDIHKDINIGTIMHEVSHQLSFNTGLLNLKGDVPLWLAEGLACYCEPTDRGTWVGVGEPNQERLAGLALALQGKKLIPLKDLVSSDAWMGSGESVGPNIITGYAQSWALFKFFMDEKPKALRAYLKAIESRQKANRRLADFCEAFGSDFARLDDSYQLYVVSLIRQHYKARK